jgi:transglutaminase-like putative cysteine protease
MASRRKPNDSYHMRLNVSHRTTYHYGAPAARVIQVLRMTPRNHDGQYVAHWRIDVSADCRLDQHEDAFGNITHAFAADGPLAQLTLLVEGQLETRDANGVVRDAAERFPPSLFLRETPLTACNADIAAFAAAARAAAGAEPLPQLHWLLDRLNADMEHDPKETRRETTAAEALARKRGAAADFTHVFVAAARCLGIPARYAGGYFCGEGASEPGTAHGTTHGTTHAWAEAHVGGLGWVAFDPAMGICATDAHARVAVGLDYLGAAPVRGMRYGGTSETLAVDIHIDQAFRQTQS